MKAELIKNFVKRELLNKHLTNELGQLSQYGKEFMMNHFHLLFFIYQKTEFQRIYLMKLE